MAETARDIQVATYEKTVQDGVPGGLRRARYAVRRLSAAAQRAEVDAYATSLRLSMERYRSGADSYLSVLDSQRSLYVGQTALIALQLTEQSNRIALFKVLGGE